MTTVMECSDTPSWTMNGEQTLAELDTLHHTLTRLTTRRLDLFRHLDQLGHAKDLGARDTTELLDRLGIDTFVVGGLSMGGQIVMELHRQVSDRIRGLILADTSALADSSAARQTRLDTAERLIREGMDPYAEEVLPKMVAPHNITALPDVAEHVLTMMRGANPEGAAAALRGRAERPDYTESLSQVAVPALVVVGSDDEFTPIGDAKHIADHIADARLAVIDGAAHLPNLERTAEFDAAVLSFLDTIGGAR